MIAIQKQLVHSCPLSKRSILIALASRYSKKCSRNTRKATNEVTEEVSDDQLDNRLPNREISLTGPVDSRLPLPGNVGLWPLRNGRHNAIQKYASDVRMLVNAVELSEERHSRIFDNFIYDCDNSFESTVEGTAFECFIMECPQLLFKDFQEIFPFRILENKVTLIMLHQKSGYESQHSSADEIMQEFINTSKDICRKLAEVGYWAHYVNPLTTILNYEFTNSASLEASDRFRTLGYSIKNNGSCKSIIHHKLGKGSFMGSLFTNAPVDSSELKSVLNAMRC